MVVHDADLVDVPQQMALSVYRRLMFMSTSEGLNPVYSDEGDSATFEVIIKNAGNTGLMQVVLTDSAVNANGITCDQDFSATNSDFLPESHPSGTIIVCTVIVPLTSSQVNAGGFSGTSKVCHLKYLQTVRI